MIISTETRSREKAPRRARANSERLRQRLAEADEIVSAIRRGQVDALVVSGAEGDQVYTLRGMYGHYRALVEEMNEGALTLSDDGILLYCNRRFAEMLKMPLDRILGAPFRELVAASDRDHADRVLAAGAARASKEEIVLMTSDGQARVTQLSLRAMVIEQVPCLSGIVMDVTAQKQAEEQIRRHAAELEQRVAERTAELETINGQLKNEIVKYGRAQEALRESELRFRRLAENAQDLIYRIEFAPLLHFEYVSPSITAMTGHTPEEFYADPDLVNRVVFPDDRPLLAALNNGQVSPDAPLALRWIHREGRLVWTEQRIVPRYDQAGHLVAVEGIARDVTERKQAEEALRTSEERFRLALADSRITVFAQDGELRYTWVYNSTLGFSPEEMVGRTDAELWPPDQAAQLMELKHTVLETGKGRRGEVELGQGAETRVFDLTVESRYDLAGDVVGITCVSVDVSDRKRNEQALQQANRSLISWASELEQRNREISLLNEMGDLLQSCLTFEEAYRVISQSARNLFPSDAGGLYVLDPAKNTVEAVAFWGDPEPTTESVFAPDDCWALRRGRIHVVADTHNGLLCAHVPRESPAASYLCIPMMAQGETLGVFYLQSGAQPAEATGSDRASIDSHQRLAVSIAEHVALALSSLRLRETLRRQAIRDPLTGLFNRRYMEESLERELRRATRKSTSVGIVMLDLDYFKHFNDTFGHEAGDVILHAFGDFLQRHIRGGDIACRYGGEEFTLILPETTLEETIERAQQVRRELEKLNIQHKDQFYGNLSVSLGIAVYPQHAQSAEEILRAADLALYQAKSEGRNRVAVTPE